MAGSRRACRSVLAYLSMVSVCASCSYSRLPPTAAGSLDRSHAGMKLDPLAGGSDASARAAAAMSGNRALPTSA